MKILVISLLRLGDILLSTSVLRNLKKNYPHAEIHILINGQFRSVIEMIPFVDKTITFDREGIQQIIGSPERNLLEAYFQIEDLVEQLKTEKYDQVINLTHNRLSGWLAALIDCSTTRGVVLNSNGRFSMGSDWFRYLNDLAESPRRQSFHFVDIFHYGTGLEAEDRRIELKGTERGKLFARQILGESAGKTNTFIQPSSSEPKKTFTPEKWKRIGEMIHRAEKNSRIFVLGSPSEKETLEAICHNSPMKPVTCDLAQAFGLLNEGQLLITVDTSIKHMASATKIKILEISLGSSEYHRTGAYAQGAVIIQGRVPCAPCPHRSPCTQKTHECSDKISAEMVAMVAGSLLRHDEGALRILAHEYREDTALLRTHINVNGDWAAYPLETSFSAPEIQQWVDRVSQKLHLQKVQEKAVGEYGSEGVELKQLLLHIFPERSPRDWAHELKSLEGQVVWLENQLERHLSNLRGLLSDIQDSERLQTYIEDVLVFCEESKRPELIDLSGLLQDPQVVQSPFLAVKRIRENLSGVHQKAKIELKLIRGLQTGFMEMI